MEEIVFDGQANIYLEGMKALWPIPPFTTQSISYAVGAENGNILVEDYRIQANSAVLKNKNLDDFADYFNQPARVIIQQSQAVVKIVLHEAEDETISPVLWLGVIHDGQMPLHHIVWQAFQVVNDRKSVAFAAIVKD